MWQFVWQAVKGLFTIKDFLIRRQLMQDRIHKNVLLNLASGTFKDNWCVLSDVCSSQTKNALSCGLSGDGRVTCTHDRSAGVKTLSEKYMAQRS